MVFLLLRSLELGPEHLALQVAFGVCGAWPAKGAPGAQRRPCLRKCPLCLRSAALVHDRGPGFREASVAWLRRIDPLSFFPRTAPFLQAICRLGLFSTQADVRIGLEEGSCVAAGYTEDAGEQQPPEPSNLSSCSDSVILRVWKSDRWQGTPGLAWQEARSVPQGLN